MDKTNKIIVDLVKKTVRDSNLMKESYKELVMSKKVDTDKDIEKKRKDIEDSIQRIQYKVDNIENQIVDLEVERTLETKNKSIVNKLIKRYEEELENERDRYKLKEEELGRLDDEQVWVDWLGTFGKELNLNTKSETKTREWLLGLIDKIVVKGQRGNMTRERRRKNK